MRSACRVEQSTPAEVIPPVSYAPEDLLTPAELARRLKVAQTWVYEQTRARAVVRSEETIPVVPVGRYLRFHWPSICTWLRRKAETRTSKPKAKPRRRLENACRHSGEDSGPQDLRRKA